MDNNDNSLYKKQVKSCNYDKQDEDTHLNRSTYNDDNSLFKKQLTHCHYPKEE